MPFKSRSQLGLCYRGGMKGVNCDEWLKETKNVCCLPYKAGGKYKSRCQKVDERIKGRVQKGPRGGRYFIITEKSKCCGEICKTKVYLSKKR